MSVPFVNLKSNVSPPSAALPLAHETDVPASVIPVIPTPPALPAPIESWPLSRPTGAPIFVALPSSASNVPPLPIAASSAHKPDLSSPVPTLPLPSASIAPALPFLRAATEKEKKFLFADAHDPIGRTVVPLRNLGNTCYLAVIAQTFLMSHEQAIIKKICYLVQQDVSAQTQQHLEAAAKLLEFIDSYRTHAKAKMQRKDPSHYPASLDIALLRDAIEKIRPDLAKERDREQDADEMIGCLYDFIYADQPMALRQTRVAFDLKPGETLLTSENDDIVSNPRDVWLEPQMYNGRCHIPLVNHSVVSFAELFQSAFYGSHHGPIRRGVISGQEMQEKEVAVTHRREQLSTAPLQLVLSLNRSLYAEKDAHFVRGKIEGVDEILEVPADYFGDAQKACYRLDGVIVFDPAGQNRANSGHYWALTRKYNPNTGQSRFMVADDDTVGYISLEQGETEMERILQYAGNAYILIYTKVT